MQINAGSVAEQYVAQELLSYADIKLHFWAREARRNNGRVAQRLAVSFVK